MKLRSKRPLRRQLPIWLTVLVIAAAGITSGVVWYAHQPFFPARSAEEAAPRAAPKVPPTAAPSSAAFNKSLYSLSDPRSPWVVVNKARPLAPANYAPADLVTISGGQVRKQAADALTTMFKAAQADGITLTVVSGYRSYASQTAIYNQYVARDGQSAADTYSARPGYSEHQTGWAADLGPATASCPAVEQCYANTSAGKWVAANAYRHGFIVRYQSDKVPITGYEYEPWHVRYIGPALSQEMQRVGVRTLEEFFGLPAAAHY